MSRMSHVSSPMHRVPHLATTQLSGTDAAVRPTIEHMVARHAGKKDATNATAATAALSAAHNKTERVSEWASERADQWPDTAGYKKNAIRKLIKRNWTRRGTSSPTNHHQWSPSLVVTCGCTRGRAVQNGWKAMWDKVTTKREVGRRMMHACKHMQHMHAYACARG